MRDATTTGGEYDPCDLVDACMAGDAQSLSLLLDHVLDAVTRASDSATFRAASKLGVKNLFLRAMTTVVARLHDYDSNQPLETWLDQVVQSVLEDSTLPESEQTGVLAILMWWEMSKLDRATSSPRTELRRRLQQLLQEDLNLVVLSAFYSVEVVARALGATPDQIRARLESARTTYAGDAQLVRLLLGAEEP